MTGSTYSLLGFRTRPVRILSSKWWPNVIKGVIIVLRKERQPSGAEVTEGFVQKVGMYRPSTKGKNRCSLRKIPMGLGLDCSSFISH